ncbi:MAG: phosphate ABC transporter permease PstA [Sedimentisphaerales bacterium]|nr:phosphate ABC transporter permease PstA [Sedimentisphaerales bacterium]
MKIGYRQAFDKTFTITAGLSVFLMVMALVIILGPMLSRGSKAVFFRGTVEFRKMQLAIFNHGSSDQVQAETARVEKAREPVYELLENFQIGIDVELLTDKTREIYRELGQQLRQMDVDRETYAAIRAKAKDIRDTLSDILESTDKDYVNQGIEVILKLSDDPDFKNTVAEQFFPLARMYGENVKNIDLTQRDQYIAALEEVKDALRKLFGPLPGESTPPMPKDRYGATRWDTAQQSLHQLLWAQAWVETKPGESLEKISVRRDDPQKGQFAGTSLEPLFSLVENNLDDMLQPEFTIYWRYFLDDWVNSHYFGGVGSEIIGTLLLTLLSMMFAVPLGVISAAYLVECADENMVVKIIRTCVNTLAGVPSIVFGLFGLAFFVLFLFPRLNMPSKPCILSAALTLSILVLPVIIRASEEAIKSVPQTYKEASLSLGAGRFRTFVTVTLPAALPGILTGIILSLGRAAGETAPILFTGAVAMGPQPKSLFDGVKTLSYSSLDIATGDRLAMMAPHKQYGVIMTLIILVLCLNILAIIIRWRVAKKLRGY